MNTIDILGEEEIFRNIVERTITELEDSEIEVIGIYAFYSCSALTSVSLPAATSIGIYAFYSCSALTSIELPAATSIGSYAFYSCSALTSIELPAATSIGDSAFESCSKLTTLYIGTESDTVCTLSSTNAIPSSVTDIYVPEALVDSYKTATNWSSFADKIKAYTGV